VEQGATVEEVKAAAIKLVATRPTAVNLKNYMDTILQQLPTDPDVVLQIGQALFYEDVELCENIANHGASLISGDATIMTYCNTGSLATAGVGTALGVIKQAYLQKRIKHVFACETRPLLQGGRLTAWELAKAEIPHTLICDNMAAMVMAQGKINGILVGADRIAKNGDTANKIGTYSLAVLAKHHGVPFYVVAPYTTLDPKCASGKDIEIELRNAEEVKGALGKITWTPSQSEVYNPSFDVTPAELISGFILDVGVFAPKYLSECGALC
ncbi:MAG TPA: S-methyl-5-thioribose-1-phosphate isomerase, partial [Candidatus Berkiella sp.]|nr:S-methyl-5-thioribose-1-phosphate isomerase [Candidatus Berkiella sp.]